MGLGALDIIVFVVFVAAVITVGLMKSRKEKTAEDFFLAGRGLSWWLIGFSLIAANISSEQFVGMSGNAASHVGMAIASYEWMAAITLVVVAFAFLPYFLRAGIYTIPEFLEYRYNPSARFIMAVMMLLIYMLLLGAVTYSGALTVNTMAEEMNMPFIPSLAQASLVIGLIAMVYVAAGGLKACAWADLIQGSALIIGGAIVMICAFKMLGGATEAHYIEDVRTGAVGVKAFTQDQGAMERFVSLNRVRLNMFLPKQDSVLPWTALLLGLWIPNFYYWGLNQYITQRTLGSASLAQGQKGIVFAAFMKLLIPFVIVIPGIIAFNLYAPQMKLKAVDDNAAVFARYRPANPDTKLVLVAESPTSEAIANLADGALMVAVYPDKAALKAGKVKNEFVLPITKDDYDKLETKEFSVFKSDDKSWKEVFSVFAVELDAYNEKTVAAAKAAGAKIHTEKFIGYKYDSALAQLLANALPRKVGLVGFVLAALLGAIVSSLAAMLNAASTIFTMDIYKKYIKPDASQGRFVFLGRVCVVVFSGIAIFLAPVLGNPKYSHSIFTIIQESQGCLSPGILSVFVFGLLVRRGPGVCGAVGLITNIIVYGGLKIVSTMSGLMENDLMSTLVGNFLNRMAISFVACLIVMTIITMVKPLPEPVVFRQNTTIDLTGSRNARLAGIAVVVLTLLLYVVFSPIGLAR
ncbi:MAG: sodium:proton symporter [Planctomycetota bacterium]|nr:MAG: sodium:proton symporter [Planctomycetota bacterium]